MLSYKRARRFISARGLVLFAVAAILLPSGLDATAEELTVKEDIKNPVTIISDTMEADKTGKTVVFTGNVVVKEDFLLCSDRLVITYGDDEKIRIIVGTGNVRLFQGNRVATGDKVVYDRDERIVVLTGNPKISQCADTVSGDRIRVFLDQENSIVESDQGGRVRAVIMPNQECEESKPVEEDICGGAR